MAETWMPEGLLLNLLHSFSRGHEVTIHASIIPYTWQGVNFHMGSTMSSLPVGGAAAILLSLLTLTIQFTMGATYTWGDMNYADAFSTSRTVAGLLLLVLGAYSYQACSGKRCVVQAGEGINA